MNQLYIEALSVGILTSIVGFVIQYALSLNLSSSTELILFLLILGIIIHILCEISGINKWYCENGNACKKQ